MIVHYEVRHVEPDITVGIISGQLNLGSKLMEDVEDDVKERIKKGARKFVLDLTKLTYIDSAGLGMLVTCSGTMAKEGGKLVVVSAGGKIAQMLELTRLNTVIGLFPTVADACKSFSATEAAPKA